MIEMWKPVVGYEEYYDVSNSSKIRNAKTLKLLKPSLRNGYYRVWLNRAGHSSQKSVHRLVAEAFILNPGNKPYIDHIDTNPSNNIVENLRWVTQKENCNNVKSLGNYRMGHLGKSLSYEHRLSISKAQLGHKISEEARGKIAKSKLGRLAALETKLKMKESHKNPILQLDLNNNPIKEWISASEAARELHLDASSIAKCCRKVPHYYTVGGFKWIKKTSLNLS